MASPELRTKVGERVKQLVEMAVEKTDKRVEKSLNELDREKQKLSPRP